MRLSVVIATYNRAELVTQRAIPSVLALDDTECLVVGDGTDEATVEAMAAIADPRVRFWNLPHATYPVDPEARWCCQGTTALNFGLDHARGEWTTFMGDDDALLSGFADALISRAGDADVVYGRSEVVGFGVLGSWPPRPSGFVHTVWRTAMGYRFDPECWRRGIVADWELWSRMLADGREWRFVDEVVYRYFPAAKVPQVDAA